MCISVNAELVWAVPQQCSRLGCHSILLPWDLDSHHSPQDQRWWWQQGAWALWAWQKSCHHHFQEKQAGGDSSSTLFPFFWHERWFGARFCMMALPIQNVLQEQLLIISIEKRQLIMYCPQSVFYSLCGATGMFSNVAYSPNKYFYLAGTLAACLNVV